jgi:hypothetical protein
MTATDMKDSSNGNKVVAVASTTILSTYSLDSSAAEVILAINLGNDVGQIWKFELVFR